MDPPLYINLEFKGWPSEKQITGATKSATVVFKIKMKYSFEEFQRLSTDEKIDYACVHEPVASREMPPHWYFIIYRVDDFYVELRFDEFQNDHLAVDARPFSAAFYNHYLEHDFLFVVDDILISKD